MSEDNREPPPGVIVASNGAWQDAETRRFVKGGKPVTAIRDTETAIEYHRLLKEKKVAGILAADGRLQTKSPDYWGDLAVAMYEQGKGKGSQAPKAVELVGKMTGYLAAGRQDDGGPAPGTARIEFDAEFIAEVKARIDSHRGQEPPD
jgi:hypothetical protein